MFRFNLPLTAAVAASLALAVGTPAFAATSAKPAPAAKPAAKPASRMVALTKPAPKPHAVPHVARAHPAGGRMVQARLANGKVVTYDCGLPGNQTKQACKR